MSDITEEIVVRLGADTSEEVTAIDLDTDAPTDTFKKGTEMSISKGAIVKRSHHQGRFE